MTSLMCDSFCDSSKAADGLTLHEHIWRPIDPVAVVMLVHGYAEHGGRYRWLASQLMERYHERLNEPEKMQVLSDLETWLKVSFPQKDWTPEQQRRVLWHCLCFGSIS